MLGGAASPGFGGAGERGHGDGDVGCGGAGAGAVGIPGSLRRRVGKRSVARAGGDPAQQAVRDEPEAPVIDGERSRRVKYGLRQGRWEVNSRVQGVLFALQDKQVEVEICTANDCWTQPGCDSTRHGASSQIL